MNIEIDIKCIQRGFFPKGGGKIILNTKPIKGYIPSFDLTKRGTIVQIYGHVIIGGRGLALSVGDDVVKGALRELRGTFGKQIAIKIDVLQKHKIDSYSDGIGIVIVAETDTKCLFGGSALKGPSKGRRKSGKRGKYDNSDSKVDYEEIGRVAARELITDWNSTKNGCTDRWLQDQLVLFMALAKGKSRMATCSMELHTETAIYIAELLTGVKFDVSTSNDGTVFIECEGMAYNTGLDDTEIGKNVEQKVDDHDDNDNNDNQNDNDDVDDSNKQNDQYLTNRPSLF